MTSPTNQALKSLSIDEDRRFIIIRLISREQAISVFEGLNERLLSLESPWEYDVIYDLRRHDAPADLGEMQSHADKWREAIAGRDAGRATLIVTRDPLLRSRQFLYQQHSPCRTVMMFDTLDEALEWLEESRTKAA